MDLDGEEITVTENMVEIRISSREGLNVGTDNKNFVILNTEITEELYLEGLARELVNKIQNMRKEQDLNVADRIIVSYKANEKVEQMIKEYEEYIRTETLAIKLNQKDNLTNKIDLNEHEVFLEIEKAN